MKRCPKFVAYLFCFSLPEISLIAKLCYFNYYLKSLMIFYLNYYQELKQQILIMFFCFCFSN